jgi:molybdenum cofactor cytidylyltransferase
LLRFRGRSLLRHAAETALAASCRPVVVVLGAGNELLRPELAGLPLQIVFNPHWTEGVASSIRAGIEAVTAGAVLFTLCDQPLVAAEMLNQIVRRHRRERAPVVASEYEGTLGVPALFSREFFPELAALKGDAGAKKILLRYADQVVRVPMPEAAFDVDRMEQAALLARQ